MKPCTAQPRSDSLRGRQPNSPTAQQPNSPTAQQPNSPTAQQPNSPTAVKRKGKSFFFYVFLIAIFLLPLGQGLLLGQNIAINETGTTAVPSALLDLQPDVSLNKGLLIPRLTTAQRNAIASPANSLMIFNITCSCFQSYVNGSWQDVWCTGGGCCTAPGQPISISGNTPVSCNTTQTYSTSVSNATSYNWTLSGGGNIQSGQGSTSINVYWNTAGTFTVSVTASNACGTSAAQTLVVTVNGPCCTLTASAGTNTVVACTGTNYTIGGAPTASGGTAPYTYAWNPPTNLNYTVTANPVANPITNTTYTVTVTDATACTATSTVSITINCTNSWCQKANFGGTGRMGAVGFSIGTKGYIGTGSTNGTPAGATQDFWEWDQSTNVWTQKANFSGTARFYATGFSIGTKGYIGTGQDAGGMNGTFYEWDQATNVWTQKANFIGTARQVASGFSIGTKGYIGLGSDGANKQDFYEWSQATNVWTAKANFTGTARGRCAAFSIGTKGYIGTGTDGARKQDFYEWDQVTNAWMQKANFGGTARQDAVGFSIGTKGYIGTGNDGANKQDFYEYTWGAGVMGGSWAAKTNFGGTARNQAVGFSIGTKGYIGTGNDGAAKQDFWEYCQ